MSYSETDYIEICKKQLETKFSFGNGHGYTQKDLELLSIYIEDKTGVSISLSTLKRLWKNNFKQGPQLATLNALVGVLGYTNWQHFKLENKENEFLIEKPSLELTPNVKRKVSKKKMLVLLVILISITAVFFLLTSTKKQIIIDGPVIFEANKTITKGVPNTVIFNYDISKIEADSFFIQQSWNRWRREKIDSKQKVFSSIYYESGFHRAKLIANNQIIARKNIHILSDGWEPHLYYKQSDKRYIDFKGVSFINEGQLHIPMDILLQKNIDISKKYETRVSHSQAYNISSDNFSFRTRTKVDANQLNTNCPWFNILIVTEKHIFSVGLRKKGCETYALYKLGEIYRDGKNTDLRLLGLDVFEWHEIGIEVRDKTATILIDGKPGYTETFKEDFGNIVGLTYIFEGTGSIDYAILTDEKGEVTFKDNFGD